MAAATPTADFPQEAPASAAGFGVERIARLILALPRGESETLMAEVRHQLGEGPSVAAAMSIRTHAAEGRLYRARVRLLRALHEHELIDDEMENPDG